MISKTIVISASAAVVLAAALTSTIAAANETRATRGDAEKMVKQVLEVMKKNGKEKTYSEITAPSKTYVDRDLYVVVYDLKGVPLAHGQNARQVGKSLIDLKDPDGKLFIQERVDLAKSKGKFWQDYKFTDPLTKKVLPKQMYCERSDDVVVCGGIYKEGA
ncbi:MAG: cache domain-containing protein [Betaproteobacteria bacterium]|nr:cache domain-containing protein [Betaproteobacteria bacterium]